MKEKKKSLVKKAIKELRHISNLDELEDILGVKLTPELLHAINKRLKSIKKRAEASRRQYSGTGQRQLAAEGKAHIGEISELQEKLSKLKKEAKEQEEISPTDKLIKERNRIISELEEGDFWLDEETHDLFQFYQRLTVHGDRIDVLREIAYRYMENAQNILGLEEGTVAEMREQEKEGRSRNRMRSLLYPWRRPSLPTKETYQPFTEKLEEIINRAKKNKTVLELLVRLEGVELEEEKLTEKPEMTSEELMNSRQFIIPTNEIEAQYQSLLQKIDSDEYEEKDIPALQGEMQALFTKMQNLPRYELSELTRIAKSVINVKRRLLTKNDNSQKKDFLKLLEKQLDSLTPVIYEDTEDTRPYYDILAILMRDDRNFDYIMELLQIEEFRRARTHIRKTSGTGRKQIHYTEKQHIVLLALDNFIKNYRKKLANQHLPLIEPSFYKEIIKQMIQQGIELTPDELALYTQRLDEFKTQVINRGYQLSQQALDDISEISNIWKVTLPKRNNMSKNIQLSFEEISGIINQGITRGVQKNHKLGNETYGDSNTSRTFLIEGLEPYAFSLQYLPDGSRLMGVHILDTTQIMAWDDELQPMLRKYPKATEMHPDKAYPTFAFNCGIGLNNNLFNSKMTPANIVVGNYFTKEDLEDYRDYQELREFKNWIQLLQEKYLIDGDPFQPSDVKNIISGYLSELISSRLEQQRIPLIYRSTLPNQQALIENNHNETCTILSKIPKKQAHQIYRILDSNQIASTYYVLDKTVDSQLELDPITPSGMYLLGTLQRISQGRYNLDEATSEIEPLLKDLNSTHQYLPSSLATHNEKSLTRKAKEFKKAL